MANGKSNMLRMLFCFVHLLLFARVQAVTNTTLSCCAQLHRQLPQKLFAYNDHMIPRWSKTADLTPRCSFFPTDAEEVSVALRILANSACPFSIKSGGHSPWPGMNSIDDGVALDLGWINQTTLANDRSHVVLGAGGTWGNAYAKLEPYGVLFPGGRASEVGIGGLTLGGGYSWTTPRTGFVADNVISYEIVLATGSIVIANATSNDDLFMALKGGGNNFGVLTRIWLQCFENHALWGGVAAVDVT